MDLFSLSDDLLRSLFSDWLTVVDFCRFDVAVCNHQLRQQLEALLHCRTPLLVSCGPAMRFRGRVLSVAREAAVDWPAAVDERPFLRRGLPQHATDFWRLVTSDTAPGREGFVTWLQRRQLRLCDLPLFEGHFYPYDGLQRLVACCSLVSVQLVATDSASDAAFGAFLATAASALIDGRRRGGRCRGRCAPPLGDVEELFVRGPPAHGAQQPARRIDAASAALLQRLAPALRELHLEALALDAPCCAALATQWPLLRALRLDACHVATPAAWTALFGRRWPLLAHVAVVQRGRRRAPDATALWPATVALRNAGEAALPALCVLEAPAALVDVIAVLAAATLRRVYVAVDGADAAAAPTDAGWAAALPQVEHLSLSLRGAAAIAGDVAGCARLWRLAQRYGGLRSVDVALLAASLERSVRFASAALAAVVPLWPQLKRLHIACDATDAVVAAAADDVDEAVLVARFAAVAAAFRTTPPLVARPDAPVDAAALTPLPTAACLAACQATPVSLVSHVSRVSLWVTGPSTRPLDALRTLSRCLFARLGLSATATHVAVRTTVPPTMDALSDDDGDGVAFWRASFAQLRDWRWRVEVAAHEDAPGAVADLERQLPALLWLLLRGNRDATGCAAGERRLRVDVALAGDAAAQAAAALRLRGALAAAVREVLGRWAALEPPDATLNAAAVETQRRAQLSRWLTLHTPPT